MTLARWALSVGAIGVIGAFGAHVLLRRVESVAPDASLTGRRRAVARLTVLLAMLLTGATAWVFFAQLDAWFGSPLPGRANALVLLTETYWGRAWADLALAAILATALSVAGAVWSRAAASTAFLAAVLVTWSVPLVGHGSSHTVAILMWHRAHLFGAGLWLGTLFVLVLAFGPSRWRPLMAVLRCFRPMAVTGALTMLAAGLVLTYEHIRPLNLLWTTDYGLTLAAKSAVTCAILVVGAFNSRQPRTALVIGEVAAAIFAALFLAARLGELPMPH